MFSLYAHPSVFRVLFLGISSGLALLLSGNTLNFWLAKDGIDTIHIGLFSLVALPYILKYIWAPIIDSVQIPYLSQRLGRRRSWALVSQSGLILALIGLGFTTPQDHLLLTGLCAFAVALCAATQDSVIDAYRVESLPSIFQGTGSAIYILGYRLGMLISGAGAIYLSVSLSWEYIYSLMSILIAFCMGIILLSPEPSLPPHLISPLGSFKELLIKPFHILKTYRNWPIICLFIILYKLSDNMAGVMVNPFLLSLGFNEIEIASAAKFFGITMSVMGGLVSGVYIHKIGVERSLLFFGVLHLLTHGLLIIQAWVGYHIPILYLGIGIGHFTGGMTMAALITYLTSLCQGPYIATQYALFSSLLGVSRAVLPASAGWLANKMGWMGFFWSIIFLSIPGLLLIPFLSRAYFFERNPSPQKVS